MTRLGRLAAAAFTVWLGFGENSARAAWEAEHWLTAGFGAVSLLGASAILLFLTELRRASRERAAHQAEMVRLDRDGATARDALARTPALLLFWRRGQPEAELINNPKTPFSPFSGIVVRRLDDLAKHLNIEDFDALRGSLARLEPGDTLRQTCRSADGGKFFEADAVADDQSICLTLRNSTAEVSALSRLETESDAHRRESSGLKAVADAISVPMWRRDASLALVWCNPAYAAAVEAAPADILKWPGIELVPKPNGGDALALARQAIADGKSTTLRTHVVLHSERRLLEIIESPAVGGGSVGWARDVTDIEVAQGTLKQHVSAHAEVLESLSTAIAIYGSGMRLCFFNSEFTKLFQLDELFLRTEPTISAVIDAMREVRRLPEQADWRSYKSRLQRLFTTVTEPMEEILHLPDGAALRQIVTPHPFGGLMFIMLDVTDRFALERSHSTLTAVQRATLDNLYEAVVVFGASGRLKLSNPGYAAMWGLDATHLSTEPHINDLLDLIQGHFDPADFDRQHGEFIARLSERTRSTQRFARRDGKVFDCTFVPLPDGATLVTYLDISDSFQVEQALRERTEALETTDRLKSEFVANVSYELRTPLNIVIGFTEILVNQYFGPLNERQLEYARSVLESSKQLLELINDILDLSTIEAGLIQLEIESVDAHGVLASMLNLEQESARKQRLELVLDYPRSIGRFDADERPLKQGLFNLLSNALKFTPAVGRITLGGRRDDSIVTIWVADTGVGIDREDQKNVFRKFHRGTSPLARQTGAGLGLSLVRYFVELHGGRLQLDPQADVGTTVTCHFPLGPKTNVDTTSPFIQ
ncbi:MAG: PAS domain-containing sensor histidine kinase [Alphaproteobacteria bacterium]|nr:PAS domain-containing sensor histidine kinase [Alphaproteobacteria bacterium]